MKFIHQTKIWASFREKAKHEKSFEISVKKHDKEVLHAWIQKMPLRGKASCLYCNRGPIFENFSDGGENFMKQATEIAHQENAVFLRIEPPIVLNSKEAQKYQEEANKLGFRKAHTSHQPECTTIIDLTKSLDEILANMKQKGRYNIRLAEKKGVKIRKSEPSNAVQFEKDIDSYYKILDETTKRDSFCGHGKKFYSDMVRILGEKGAGALYIAEYEGEAIAGLIATFYEKQAIYYYGASSDKHRNVMAPYLLQWHVIKEAKTRGMESYDFLGIAPPGAKNHPWEGVTGFKMKFGGEIVQYVPAKEYVFKPFLYCLMLIIKKLSRFYFSR
ncbi:peptidoglycan bridge formation glycyltransferase FemA/FemB family protein [Patescibacteria group bacterium]|nr:peptidoglycan bridge formation glycyltransferase FemA/FemB family protein [Patescibacteria group bacterium]